jgi:hypothetical protein
MSAVMASDYRVRDFDTWWDATEGGRLFLRELRAHHLVVYRAISEPQRIFVTLGIQSVVPVQEVLRSGGLLKWYDAAGVEDIPPVFVGRPVEKVRYFDDGPEPERTVPAVSVVVARIMPVRDLTSFLRVVHDRRERRIIAGCRQYWTYQAIDDPAEVMTLQEIDTLEHAQAWLSHPEARREFFESAGVGIYPDTFVGRLVETVDIEPAPGV